MKHDTSTLQAWEASTTREGALNQLERFLPEVPAYAAFRNRVEEGHPFVSKLSSALSTRLITEYEVAAKVLSAHSFESAEKFLQEVAWRLYWKGWMEWHPNVWQAYRLRTDKRHAEPEMMERYHALSEGRAPHPLMNRFIRELRETGYLHNHARMWLAAYWIHDVGLPWEWGAEFFYQHLLDADAASNTLSWRWVAGRHTKGKVYRARRDNILRYCRYDEATDASLSDLANSPDAPCPWEEPDRLNAWPETTPGTIPNDALLWIHGADLSFWENQTEVNKLNVPTPSRAVILWDERLMDTVGLSQVRRRAMRSMLDDAASRWRIGGRSSVDILETDWCSGLTHMADQYDCRHVVAMHVRVGILQDTVMASLPALENRGIQLNWLSRPQDEQVLKLAKGGFFSFWKEVSARWRAGQWIGS
ncbi:MAG: FAD-binding domain-containing protein [Candidatus Methylacidiphilales bacterium]